MNKNYAVKSPSGLVSSFEEQLKAVKEYVELEECINMRTGELEEMYEELCLIITEVLRMPKSTSVKIAGEYHSSEDLRAVFRRLRSRHLQYVVGQYKAADYPIRFKKAYLRSALYNSVFELESGMLNELKTAGVI